MVQVVDRLSTVTTAWALDDTAWNSEAHIREVF